MILFLVLGLSLTLLAYAITNFFLAIIVYIAFGIFWYRVYYLGKPIGQRSPMPSVVLILQWPLASLYDAFTLSEVQNHPGRFTVLYGDTRQSQFVTSPSGHSKFPTYYDEAVAFARKVAGETGIQAVIFDMAEHGKAPLTGEPCEVMYWVSPSGEVTRKN